MKHLKQYLQRNAWLFSIAMFFIYGVSAVTIVSADWVLAKKGLAVGIADTTVASRAAYELRGKSGHVYMKVSRTSGYWVCVDCGSGGGSSGTTFIANKTGSGDTVLIPGGPDTLYLKPVEITSADATVTITNNTTASHISLDLSAKNVGNTDLTLSANRSISGNAKSLNIGTPGSNLSALNAYTSGSIFLQGLMIHSVDVFSSDAIHTIPANTGISELSDAALTANRVITLPTASINGTLLEVVNKGNNATFFYTFGSTVTDNTTASTVTNIGHRTSYVLEWDAGNAWRIIFKY